MAHDARHAVVAVNAKGFGSAGTVGADAVGGIVTHVHHFQNCETAPTKEIESSDKCNDPHRDQEDVPVGVVIWHSQRKKQRRGKLNG